MRKAVISVIYSPSHWTDLSQIFVVSNIWWIKKKKLTFFRVENKYFKHGMDQVHITGATVHSHARLFFSRVPACDICTMLLSTDLNCFKLWVYSHLLCGKLRRHIIFNSQCKDFELVKWAGKKDDGNDDITMIYRALHFCWGYYLQSFNY